ncbi:MULTISPECIES: hypothetical protein [unclassified Sphingomonas]|uniref:hypothetical protein n=1 Tax=unclassified Sphingomonas TaxID=196159 RepID=UPI002269E324|nr:MULTISPECIES: hypothetical protein [unclassified Sphingomonas]
MDYVDHTFTDERVALDGNTFKNCTFENCTLVHEGGPVTFENFGLRGSVKFDLGGGESTVKLLDYFGRALGYVEIMGRRYNLVPDGTWNAEEALKNYNGPAASGFGGNA